jgi:hypothetical protein
LLRSESPVIDLPDAADGRHRGIDWIWATFVFHEVEPAQCLTAEMRRVAVLDWRPDAAEDNRPARSHGVSAAQVGEHLEASEFRNATRVWQNEEVYPIEAY